MKHTKLSLLVAVLPLCLGGCNAQVVDTHWNFDHARLVSHSCCVDVKSWKDFENSDVVQITTTNGVIIVGHYSEIILMERKSFSSCPYCGRTKK